MKSLKKLMAPGLLAVLCAGTTASAQEAPAYPYVDDLTNPGKAVTVEKDQIKEYEELTAPFTHAVTLQGRDGIAYISQNGRFFLRGVIFDTWTGQTIETMDQLRAAKKTVNLETLGLKDKDVDPFYWGQGPKKVTLFVDPLCPFCGQLFDELIGDPSYAQNYTFTIFTVPFLGDESAKAVTTLSCAKNRDEALQALLTKDRRWIQTQPAAEGCDPQPIIQRTILSQMLGISGVPYLIGPEGGVARGLPADLRTFLETN